MNPLRQLMSVLKEVYLSTTLGIYYKLLRMIKLHLLDICFDNVNLLETSYDREMGDIQASKLIYTYTDPLENHINKKGMKIISLQGHKEIVITYGSQNHDFDKFISTVDRMVGTFRI